MQEKKYLSIKKLKGKNISIIECLTKLQMEKLQEVRETLVRLNIGDMAVEYRSSQITRSKSFMGK